MLTSFALRLLLRGQLPLHLQNLGTFNTRLTKLESWFCWLVQNLRLQVTVRNLMQNLHPHLFRLALKAWKNQWEVKSLQECLIHLQKPVRSVGPKANFGLHGKGLAFRVNSAHQINGESTQVKKQKFYCLLYDRNQGSGGDGGREEMGKGEEREDKTR